MHFKMTYSGVYFIFFERRRGRGASKRRGVRGKLPLFPFLDGLGLHYERKRKSYPSRRNALSQPKRTQVGRLSAVLFERQEVVGVAERVRVRTVLESELAVDVRRHLGVVVVETRNDHLVEVDDDGIPVAVDIAHHTVIE